MVYIRLIMVLPCDFSLETLQKTPSLLLHAKCNQTELTGADGVVGALVNNGRHIVTSPNCNMIFYPPLGGDRDVFLRRDLLFADDDPIQWPQSFLPEVPHLACIPKQPIKQSPLSVLWLMPEQADFDVEDHGILRGIGKLNWTLLSKLKHLSNQLFTRAKGPAFEQVSVMITQVTNTVQDLLHRLEHISTNLRLVQLGVRATQRALLELLACLDYMEIYRPLMDGGAPPRSAVAHVIGAFTNDLNVCNRMYRAGVPVWLIRPYMALHSIRIMSIAPVQVAQGSVELHPAIRPSYPPIYRGRSTMEKYFALIKHVSSYLIYPDPFGSTRAQVSVSAPLPHPGPSKREIRAKRYTPYTNRKKDPAALPGGRNKFEDPESPFLPPAIPVWRQALERVDITLANFAYPDLLPTDLGYVFPEPALFLSMQSPDRQKGFFRAWLQYRHALIYRVSSNGFDAKPMPNAVWRMLLSHDFTSKGNNGNTTTRSQKLRETAQDFLQSCLDVDGVELGNSDGSNLQPTWNGKQFEELGKDEFEEIIWELSELNFRFELLALDARATTDRISTRQRLISNCFARPASGVSLLVADLSSANQGLAGTTWDDRCDYVLALRQLMSSWRGEVPPIIKIESGTWAHAEAAELEEVMARFYCTTFYNYFRRAPIVPRRLSHIVSPYERPLPSITIDDPRPNIIYDLSTLASRLNA